jgi:peptidase E
MQQIISIGGGGFSHPDSSFALERYLLSRIQKPSPRICLLPQASNENREYVVKFYEAFTSLGAIPSWLSLFGKVKSGWQEQLLAQDLIYVGGGNTKSMLALWHAWGVDTVLKKALSQGTILAGVSAGAICWFEQALTDSVWPLGVVPGLGWLKGSCCPHYDTEVERRPAFAEKLKNGEISAGIAIEDHVAVHFIDGKVHKVLSSKAGKTAYKVAPQGESALAAELVS